MTVRMDIHGARRKREEEQKPKPNGEAAPAPLLRADNIGARTVSWVWYPRIPASQISILGAPGGGEQGLERRPLHRLPHHRNPMA